MGIIYSIFRLCIGILMSCWIGLSITFLVATFTTDDSYLDNDCVHHKLKSNIIVSGLVLLLIAFIIRRLN